MKRRLVLLLTLLITVSGSAQNPFVLEDMAWFAHPLSPRSVGYRMSLRLDTQTHVISGTEDIYFLNTSKAPIQTVKLHLYLNAFASNSTPMAANIRKLRKMLKVPVDRQNIGYCRITKLTANFNSILSTLEVDNTVATLQLPYALKPGESALIQLQFHSKLPRLVMRSGYAGTFHMIAQFFPKLGVLNDDGSWACEQYDGNGEFFSDFGIYDVSMTVPEHFTLLATGTKIAETPAENGKKYHFYAEDVHDFVAIAWDQFKFVTKSTDNTLLTVAYPPGHEDLALREIDALHRSFLWYTEHIGTYPYPAYTVIDVPFCGLAAGGMEYPMISTGFALTLFPKWFRLPEETVIHEFGHSYFQGMLASNENQEPWLDEGVNTYMTGLIMEDLYGACSFNALPRFCADAFQRMVGKDYSVLHFQKPEQPANSYLDRTAYTRASYNKVALLLKTVENIVGKQTMIDIMKDYFQRFQFTHPRSDNFLQVFNIHTDNRFAGLMELVINENTVPDASIIRVESNAIPSFKGFVPEKDSYLEEPEAPRKVQYRVYLGKDSLPLAVPYRIRFSDGSVERGELQPLETARVVTVEKPAHTRLTEARLDPDRQILIDLDRTNNRYGTEGTEGQRIGTSTLFLTLMELFFHVF